MGIPRQQRGRDFPRQHDCRDSILQARRQDFLHEPSEAWPDAAGAMHQHNYGVNSVSAALARWM